MTDIAYKDLENNNINIIKNKILKNLINTYKNLKSDDKTNNLVIKEYEKYFNFIIHQKEEQIKILKSILKYLETLNNSTKKDSIISDNLINDIKKNNILLQYLTNDLIVLKNKY